MNILPVLALGALCLALGVLSARLFIRHRKIDRILDAARSRIRESKSVNFAELLLELPASYSPLSKLLVAVTEQSQKYIRQLAILENREAEAQQIIEQMAEAALVVDGKKGIRIMNKVAKAWLLDSATAQVPESLELLGSTGLLNAFELCVQSPEPIRQEIKLYRAGEERTLMVSAQYVQANDRVILVIHEITKLVRLESIRQEFVANVSHELKTPVTSILGFVETLLDEEEGGAASNRLRFLNIVHGQALRLRNIIEDLLTLSRLEQEGDRIRLEASSPQSVIQKAIEACSYWAEQRNTSMSFSAEFEGTVPMNAPLLEQAVINLLENAIKYGNSGGRISVVLKEEADRVCISVGDDGPGIAQREIESIFQRFYRIDKARSRDQGGTGLGLAIVKHIARVHRGNVEATSVLGKGSVFTLSIPTSGALETKGP